MFSARAANRIVVMSLNPRLQMLLDMGEGLSSVAEATAKLAVHHYRQRRRVRRGSTVRPGARTPLWNVGTKMYAAATTAMTTTEMISMYSVAV